MFCPLGDSRGDGNANDDDDSVITDDSDEDAEGTAVDYQQQPRTPARDVTQLTSYRAGNHDSSDDTQSPPTQIKARYCFSVGSTGVPFTSGTGRQPINTNISRRTTAIRNQLNPARLFRGVSQPLRQIGSTPATVDHHSTQKGMAVNALEWCYQKLRESVRRIYKFIK